MIELLTSITQTLKNDKVIIALVIIAMVVMLLYVNYDRNNKSQEVRNAYKEEFDSFDIQSYKNYVTGGSFSVENDDAKVMDYVPTKTSKLVTNCDEKREECIEY